MERRDLKADLDWMFNAPSDHAKELEIAVHALERAIEAEKALGNETLLNCRALAKLNERAEKAEALARELKKSLKFFFDCISNGDLVEPEPSQWMSLELSPIAVLYHKAKEVLGDE